MRRAACVFNAGLPLLALWGGDANVLAPMISGKQPDFARSLARAKLPSMQKTDETNEIEARPELMERLGKLAFEMAASAEELQAAASEWAEIEAVLEEVEAELASGAPTYSHEEVFGRAEAILERRIRAAG